MQLELTEQEALDVRTALLTASSVATVAMYNTRKIDERSTLDKARWAYLQLAEKIAAIQGVTP